MLAVRLVGIVFRRDGPSTRCSSMPIVLPIPPASSPGSRRWSAALFGIESPPPNPSGGTAAAEPDSHPARRSWLPDARSRSRVSPGVLPPGLTHPPHPPLSGRRFPERRTAGRSAPSIAAGRFDVPRVYRSAMPDRDETRTTRLAANAAAVAVVLFGSLCFLTTQVRDARRDAAVHARPIRRRRQLRASWRSPWSPARRGSGAFDTGSPSSTRPSPGGSGWVSGSRSRSSA